MTAPVARKVRVAAVQAEPVWNDLQGGLEKVISLLGDAGKEGADVVGFPEVFIPGYPWSIYTATALDNAPFMDEYFHNSLAVDSDEMRRIQAAVKENGTFCVLGFSERHQGSLYISQVFINTDGQIVHHRRKTKPTHVERAYWGTGEGGSLKCVVDSPFGRIGGLNCWEHTQPLLRYYEYQQDVDIHVASWPVLWDRSESPESKWPYWLTGSMNKNASQFMALEGACFVLVCTQVMSEENFDKNKVRGLEPMQGTGGGFSAIFGPGGEPIATMPSDKEGILYANVDLNDKLRAKQWLDVVGHYSRPDLLSLRVNTHPSKPVFFAEEPQR
ncbi:hypothetical protein N7475_008780 [Penicillium sp. IBT 31633x]|nr:hypothetical protein N7475_008780 [Penicillium sp. IBT 31633x]